MPAITLSILLAVAGGVVAVLALTDAFTPKDTPRRPRRRSHRTLTARQRNLLIAGVVLGLVAAIVTGIWLLLIVVPLALFGVPWVLRSRENEAIERLDALEAWTRSLAGLTVTGTGLERTLTASRDNCPAPIREEVSRLVARINSRIPTRDALQQFADELNDETADLVAAQLILKSDLRGSGLTASLEDLAESIQSEIRVRRRIESDRSGNRNEIRIIVYLTVAALAVILVAREYAAPYATPVGQLLLTFYVAIDVGLLLMARRLSTSKPGSRVLAVSTRRAV